MANVVPPVVGGSTKTQQAKDAPVETYSGKGINAELEGTILTLTIDLSKTPFKTFESKGRTGQIVAEFGGFIGEPLKDYFPVGGGPFRMRMSVFKYSK